MSKIHAQERLTQFLVGFLSLMMILTSLVGVLLLHRLTTMPKHVLQEVKELRAETLQFHDEFKEYIHK